MSNKIRNVFFDLMVKDILDQRSADLKKSYNVDDLKVIDDYKHTKSIIDMTLKQHKKNKLIIAREHINLLETSPHKPTNHRKNLINKLIEFMKEGMVSSELSMGFRDGKEMPDEELESLIDDIEELKRITRDD